MFFYFFKNKFIVVCLVRDNFISSIGIDFNCNIILFDFFVLLYLYIYFKSNKIILQISSIIKYLLFKDKRD